MGGIMTKTIISLMMFLAPLIFGVKTWANIPANSSKELLLIEQKNLTEAVIEYKSLIHEYKMDLLNLKADREWIDVKVKRIEDQKRDVPDSLRQAMDNIDEKMGHHKKEMKRLAGLCELH